MLGVIDQFCALCVHPGVRIALVNAAGGLLALGQL